METKLQEALKVVIKSLKNDTIHYDWSNPNTCNCGLVAQALLHDSGLDVKKNVNKWCNDLEKIDPEKFKKEKMWKNAVKYLCPVTGMSNYDIFNELFRRGLTREDIVHLEYMENEAIVKRSGLATRTIKRSRQVDNGRTLEKIRYVKHSNPIKAFFGLKQEETYQEPVLDTEKYEEIAHDCEFDFKSKENLIKYLTAWLEIISEDKISDIESLSKTELEGELLKALSTEDYETAGKIRDQIFELVK